ncbi:MAG: histidine phosphatase family protein [Nitrospinaceae bacterium]
MSNYDNPIELAPINRDRQTAFLGSTVLPKKIFLVRHGTSELNEEKFVSGQLDPSLSEKGKEQARFLAGILRNEPLTGIHTSTLSRTVETARPIAVQHGLPITQSDALKEIHMGILQGRYRDHRDVEAQSLWALRKANPIDFRIPGGESYADLKQRVVPALRSILGKEGGGVILIVGHRNTNRVILETLLNWTEIQAINAVPRAKHLYEIYPGPDPRCNTILLTGKKTGIVIEGFLT